jgi:hypothetical protein
MGRAREAWPRLDAVDDASGGGANVHGDLVRLNLRDDLVDGHSIAWRSRLSQRVRRGPCAGSGAPGFFSTTAMVPSDMDSPMDGTAMSLRARRVSCVGAEKARPNLPVGAAAQKRRASVAVRSAGGEGARRPGLQRPARPARRVSNKGRRQLRD